MLLSERSSLNLFVISFLASATAYVLLQGFHLGIANFFTPLHHDDFSALYTKPGLKLTYPRPVSSNLLYNLGSLGAGFYYIFYFCLWMSCLALTQLFVFRVVDIRPGRLIVAASSFLTGAAWFSLPASVATLQYLGLSTNALSYGLGISAALVSLRPEAEAFRAVDYVNFSFLILLAAFSKEDMAAFIGVVCIYRGLRDWIVSHSPRRALVPSTLLLGISIMAYAANLIQSQLVGSPFLSGSGNYDLSSPLANAWRNLVLYAGSSRGTLIVSAAVAAMTLPALVGTLRSRSMIPISVLMLPILTFSLLLPYLLLPRFFDYYAGNFVPFSLASIVPAIGCLVSRAGRAAMWAAAVGCAAVLATVIFVSDKTERKWPAEWYISMREASRRQIEETRRAEDLGLSKCATVLVSGVSQGVGPFLAGTSGPMIRLIGRAQNWRIVAEPNTIFGNFAAVTKFSDPAWIYVPPEEASSANWVRHSDCYLRFDPNTMRASLVFAEKSVR